MTRSKLIRLTVAGEVCAGGVFYPDLEPQLRQGAAEWERTARSVAKSARADRGDRTLRRMALAAVRYRRAVARALRDRAGMIARGRGRRRKQ